ncbi:MAG: hypothetical protein A2751_00165 [Candidatus Doudnabacteria bacterium RIFCSPHIGHO2_01_FULL_46_14]|uniref:Type II secretion system protein GspG C-terminal domain-containing protein n=1 Tax=Candidatus Doudnabacteria bacterium RIFCSPHIGHO2_01_FULL_46_14 TaxID=1817824 RepID=A0A1F5NN03_9BACT|nr:MAG: hypothetical protein A2751_00165 [Candidatus Doudnabacteria bacterium RIFCSPHIGHO2_01_FULL_46_14]
MLKKIQRLANSEQRIGIPDRSSLIAHRQEGFTLIELLVVVAIVGLLLSVISVGYTAQRRNARDAKRLSDLKQIKSGMDIYFQDASGYPDNGEWIPGTTLNCASNNILLIPRDPGYPVNDYTYNGDDASGLPGCGLNNLRGGYTLRFYIEKQGLWYLMDEDGVIRDELNNNVISVDTLI